MKISIVQPRVSYFVGGSEKVALKHVEVLSQINNNSITLYTVKPVDGQYSPYFLELKRNFPNIVITELEVPEKYKYIYDEKPETTQSRWDREAILFSNIVHDSLKNQNDDIVVYYYIVDAVYRVLNIPSIVYLGGHPENEIEIYNAFLSFCDATISNSKNVQRLWMEKIERNKIQFNYVLPKGADIHESFCNQFDNTVPNIVFAGRLIKGKGVDVLIEAFNKTYQKNRDAKLWILGEGIEYPVFVNRVKNLGLDNNVYFEGMVDNVYDYFSSATLCVFPSTRMEGLMTAVVEAMSVGSCVITTKGIGNEELIEDGKTGVLVEAGNIELLHTTMESLILDPSLREKIGKEAFTYIANNHSWKKVGALLDQMLHEVINAHKK